MEDYFDWLQDQHLTVNVLKGPAQAVHTSSQHAHDHRHRLAFNIVASDRVCPCAGRDIHNLLRGLLQLCTVFQELSIVAVVLAILQTATAAAVWPLVTLPVAIVSVLITALRVITWHHPQARLPLPHSSPTHLLSSPSPSCISRVHLDCLKARVHAREQLA